MPPLFELERKQNKDKEFLLQILGKQHSGSSAIFHKKENQLLKQVQIVKQETDESIASECKEIPGWLVGKELAIHN